MRFEFATAHRIFFGEDSLTSALTVAREFGSRVLLVTGSSVARAQPVLELLSKNRVDDIPFAIAGEPTTEQVLQGVAHAKRERCDWVLAVGGGSVLDGGKAIAALLANPGDLFDYLEVIGRGRALTAPSAPFVAVPTTAGTGTEVTRNAVLASHAHRLKISLRSPLMLPRMAVIDPKLTWHLPPDLTASTGLDALTQLIEPYVSIHANAMTDLFCLDGIKRVAGSLETAYRNGHDATAREGMALAALEGGLALANARLGAVHGLAAPLGGMFPAPHGKICAALLPHVMAINVRALRSRAPRSPALDRYATIARILTGHESARPEDGVRWVVDLCARLEVGGLKKYGLGPGDFPVLVEKSAQASSMKGNPIPLEPGEVEAILQRSLDAATPMKPASASPVDNI